MKKTKKEAQIHTTQKSGTVVTFRTGWIHENGAEREYRGITLASARRCERLMNGENILNPFWKPETEYRTRMYIGTHWAGGFVQRD